MAVNGLLVYTHSTNVVSAMTDADNHFQERNNSKNGCKNKYFSYTVQVLILRRNYIFCSLFLDWYIPDIVGNRNTEDKLSQKGLSKCQLKLSCLSLFHHSNL